MYSYPFHLTPAMWPFPSNPPILPLCIKLVPCTRYIYPIPWPLVTFRHLSPTLFPLPSTLPLPMYPSHVLLLCTPFHAFSLFHFFHIIYFGLFPHIIEKQFTIHPFTKKYWRLKRRTAVDGGFHVWGSRAVAGISLHMKKDDINPLVPNSLFFDQIRWKLERALLEV